MVTCLPLHATNYGKHNSRWNRYVLGGFLSCLGVRLGNTPLQFVLLHLCGRTLMESCYVSRRGVAGSNIITLLPGAVLRLDILQTVACVSADTLTQRVIC